MGETEQPSDRDRTEAILRQAGLGENSRAAWWRAANGWLTDDEETPVTPDELIGVDAKRVFLAAEQVGQFPY